ncbi:hypothetical protein [Paenibacillus gansuensis]|uniref:Uncharacterized protein n=1 Tax=Paenibacillus gansuensis TaxID=306542 RepID=A0ABW5PHX9_9BACL
MKKSSTAARRTLQLALAAAIASAAAMAVPATAGAESWLDRLKAIYDTPEKLDKVLQDYEAAKEQLEDQRDRIREAEERQQELARQNEALLRQNEQLMKQLQSLEQARLDQAARSRRWVAMLGTAAALLLGYILSVRVWRHFIWRSQRAEQNREHNKK